MAPLRPRIWEQQIKCFDRVFRQQVANGITAFNIEHSNIFQVGGFSTGLGNASDEFLNAQEIFLGKFPRQFANQIAVATAEVDVQRRFTPEHGNEIERGKVGLRDQFYHAMKMAVLRCDSTALSGREAAIRPHIFTPISLVPVRNNE